MEFIDEKIEDYCLNHSKIASEILLKLERQTHLKMLRPRMLSGVLQGNLLRLIVQMLQAECILEIGTYTGYSAISMAEGLKESGQIHTIDCNAEIEDFTRAFFKESGLENKIHFYVDDALSLIPKMNMVFDLVFIDADKENYVEYYNLIFPKLKKGGFIVVDNVLWSGKVIEEINPKDTETQAIQQFNTFVKLDNRVEVLMLPIRDGLSLIRKK